MLNRYPEQNKCYKRSGNMVKSNSLQFFFALSPLSYGDCVCATLRDSKAGENRTFDYFDMIEAIQNRGNIFSMQFKFMAAI